MSDYTDHTHSPDLKSWVESANDPDTDFPIQNLPFGVFTFADDAPDANGATEPPRIGIAIGDMVFDCQAAIDAEVLTLEPDLEPLLCTGRLDDLMAASARQWRAVRHAVSDLLSADNGTIRDDQDLRQLLLIPQSDIKLHRPVANIGDYTDFYASISHATNVGSMFRPDNPLLPNYKHVPIGYHGRASSIVIDGTPIRRPMGQLRPDDSQPPIFEPCKLLDYEMEVGFFVGTGNELGTRIDMADAADHIFGLVLVNDWSARDVQKWEYQPLGPFNAKNFGTTVSPWVVTLDALAPFRQKGPRRGADDPQPLDYLKPAEDMTINMTVEVSIRSQQMRDKNMDAHIVSRGNFNEMYWTIAQMLVHHSSTGCNMQPGDLIASGTVSGPEEFNRGCLLERTWRGQNPIELPDGTQRKFLLDGDEVIMRGWCEHDGYRRIGFGECRGIILPAERQPGAGNRQSF